MRVLQILLVTLTAFAGCNKNNGGLATTTKVDTIKTTTMTSPVTYLALGDSYTIGEAVPDIQSYPFQLVNLLNSDGLVVQKPTIIAATGWTADDLINSIARADIQANKYSFVTLLIGVNDQYQHLSIDNYKLKFTQLLNQSIAFAGGDTSRVFVLSIPDWGVTPFGKDRAAEVSPEIDAFNAVNKQISTAAGVNYLNITEISRMAATDLTLVADDGLHPSGKMYKLWIAQLEPLVAARLRK